MNLFKEASLKYGITPYFTQEAPNTFKELMLYKDSKVLPVFSSNNEQSIWTPEENFYFRFHHDLIHIKHGLDFTIKGETETYLKQREELKSIGMSEQDLNILYFDIVGQRFYYEQEHRFINNQSKFINSCLSNGLEKTLKEFRE